MEKEIIQFDDREELAERLRGLLLACTQKSICNKISPVEVGAGILPDVRFFISLPHHHSLIETFCVLCNERFLPQDKRQYIYTEVPQAGSMSFLWYARPRIIKRYTIHLSISRQQTIVSVFNYIAVIDPFRV